MENKEWFDIHLEDISTPEDFEEAMEEAYTTGFTDGQLEADENNYADAVAGERERIKNLIKEYRGKPDFTFANLISVIDYNG